LAPSQSACLSTDLAGKLGRGMQAIMDFFFFLLKWSVERERGEVRGRRRRLGRKQQCVDCKKKERVAGQGKS